MLSDFGITSNFSENPGGRVSVAMWDEDLNSRALSEKNYDFS